MGKADVHKSDGTVERKEVTPQKVNPEPKEKPKPQPWQPGQKPEDKK